MRRKIGFLAIILMLLSLSSCFLMGEHEHTAERIEARAATCTESGNSEYYRCTECGEFFSDAECRVQTDPTSHVTVALGHTWQDATCTDPSRCAICGEESGEALGHDWSGECDTDCNRIGCSEVRVAQSHLDSDEDEICDNCGEAASADIPVGGGGGEFLPPDEF